MVIMVSQRPKPPSKSQQFGEAFSRGAVGVTSHLAQQQKEKEMREFQQQEKANIADFLDREYGLKGTENIPKEFSMQAMKGQQALGNKLAGKMSPQQERLQNDIISRSLRGEATPEEEASLAPEKQLALSKEKRLIQKDRERKEILDELTLGEEFGGIQQSKQSQNETQRQDKFNEEGEIEVGNIELPTSKLFSEKKIAKAALVNPALAQQMRAHNRSIEDKIKHDEKMALQKEKISPEHQRTQALSAQQAKADIDYNKQLQESAGLSHIKTKTLSDLEKLNNKGVTGKPYEKLLEKMGLVAYTSEGRREFAADVKHMITDIRSILGGQFSNFEFQTILNAYPSADFSEGANRAIINNLKEFQDIKNKEIEFANQIKKNNGGKIPEDFQSLVNQKVKEYADDKIPSIKANMRKVLHEEYGVPEGHMLMFDPQGEPMSVPDEMMEEMMAEGATLP